MDIVSNNALPEPTAVKPRRRHSPAFKARVLAACAESGVSVAAVARQYQLNANLIHKWRKATIDGGHPVPETPDFLPLPMPATMTHASVTLVIGELTMQWPLSHIHQAVPWLKALQS